MNKIVVKRTHIEINNYELGDSFKLENTFSIYDPVYHARFTKCIHYIPEKQKLIIPRGIDIYWIENLFMEEAFYDGTYDEFDYLDPVMIKTLPRDDVQKEALRFMIGEQEYIKNKAQPMLSVNLNTGKGKTYVSVATMAYLSIKTIIIASSVDWLNQWKDRIVEYTDIKPNEIYFISGSGSINRLLQRGDSQYKMFLVTHSTLKSYGTKAGWDKVTELFKAIRVGIKIYDECHLALDTMSMIDFYTNTYKTYYVTATPARSDRSENIIFGYYFKNVPAIDLFDEDNDPRTRYIAFRYHSHPSPQDISRCKNQYGLDRNKYTNYVVQQENFYNMMHILIDRIKRLNGKVLIYIGTNAAIDVVKEWIISNYPELAHNVGVYTSVITENKQEQLEKKIILSTTKSCGAAVDIAGLKMTIVLAEPFKSEVLARQTLGRTRDRNTVYIDIVDEGFMYTKRYYDAKKPIFSKYATSCTDIKLGDDELSTKANELYDKRNSLIHPIRYEGYDYTIKPYSYID